MWPSISSQRLCQVLAGQTQEDAREWVSALETCNVRAKIFAFKHPANEGESCSYSKGETELADPPLVDIRKESQTDRGKQTENPILPNTCVWTVAAQVRRAGVAASWTAQRGLWGSKLYQLRLIHDECTRIYHA